MPRIVTLRYPDPESNPARCCRGRVLLLIVLTLLCAPLAAATREFRLDNGLRLVVHEDHRAPVVVSQVWYRVGSSYEPPGYTGISHVLEHMMFKGTAAYGPGEFSRVISAAGGRENAFTGSDYTAYFQQLERSRLALSFELESDRMRNLQLPPVEFARELKVVMEERRLRTDDDPQALAWEIARTVAYQVSPYRQPIIGWMSDLAALTVDDLRRWYERWYQPANAVLVVAGDVEPDAVHALAVRWFGTLSGAAVEPPPDRVEPAQLGPKRAVVRIPARLPLLIVDYKVPALAQAVRSDAPASIADVYALELLAGVLCGDPGARLRRELVRERTIAASVDCEYDLYARLPTLFTFTVTPAAGTTLDAAEAALADALTRFVAQDVSAAELERARTRLVTNRLYLQDSLFYQAMEIGLIVSAGLDWRLREDYDGALGRVTPAQVRAVARAYLLADGSTVTRLEPEPPAAAH
ncbi:MAG: insulinase family protein [Gammaproteobacteria bacterium]|nr:insulinase family protein [Gammaproteobacteria bacterium]